MSNIDNLGKEYEARQKGERDALHVRNAVLVIDISVVVFVMSCVAVVLTILARAGGG